MKYRDICRWIGLAALASTTLWAMGVPGWWAPVDNNDPARGIVLFMLHFAGLVVGFISLLDEMFDR
jgi:hypothetical protein